MKKLAGILCLSAVATGAFAQGTVTFNNNAQTLVSATINNQTAAISGAAGSYYFGLLTSSSGAAGSFTFSGLYATNVVTASGGRFIGGTVGVPGWAPGTSMSYQIAGWDASLGHDFQSSWLTSPPSSGLFGLSAVASGTSGGLNASTGQTFPTLPLFGGTGITAGFNLTGNTTVVPEPSSMALAGLGAAALLIFRRRK